MQQNNDSRRENMSHLEKWVRMLCAAKILAVVSACLTIREMKQAVNDSTLASVCYTVFIPALTQPKPHPNHINHCIAYGC